MFWQGRRVFLTGHTGFKGSWLALWLEQLGASVTGYALAPAPSQIYLRPPVLLGCITRSSGTSATSIVCGRR